MEGFLPSEIARLVLGYLEEEKCEDTYTSFLQSSEHLKECYEFSKRGRKFSTKVTGKSLINLLDDYCKMCCIVQEQLKKMDRCDDNEPSLNVIEQLKLLFESMESTSPTQTMLFRVTLPSSASRSNRVQSKSVRNDRGKRAIAHVEIDNGNEISDENGNEWSCEDNIDNCNDALDVDTTPLESLPGNERSSPMLKNRRKSLTVHLEKNNDSPEKCLDFNVVQKAFLDNTELHEKIAQNINKVINTPELTILQNEIYNGDIDLLNTGPGIDKELNSIIKTIVKETENDPSFEKLINGIVVENQEIISEDSDSRVNSWSESSTPQRPSSIPRDHVHQRRRIQNTVRSLPDLRKGHKKNELTLKNRSRYLKRSSTELRKQFDTMSKIDDQNEEAIQSIIQVTQNVNIEDNSHKIHHNNSDNIENIIRSENKKIISMEGIIESVPISSQHNITTDNKQPSITTLSPTKCILTSSANTPIASVSCPDYLVVTSNQDNFTVTSSSSHYQGLQSTSNIPSNVQQTYILSQDNSATSSTNVAQNLIVVQPQYSQIPSSSSSNIHTGAQTFTINTNNHDIMQMPIVMYADSVDSSTNIQATIQQTRKIVPIATQTTKKFRPILPNYGPQPIITVQPYFEPITEPFIVETVQPTTLTLPSNVTMIQTVQPLNVNVSTLDSKNRNQKATEDPQPTPAVVKPLQKEDNKMQPTNEDQEDIQTKSKDDVLSTVTPTETIKSNRLSLSTPRSGRSHIRALDFSTPAKSSTQRKALTSPKSKGQNKSNIPSIKDARVSLFKCDDILESIPESASIFRRDESPQALKNVGIATRTPTVKPTADWDQVDLMFQSKNQTTNDNKLKRNRSFSESDLTPTKTETIKKGSATVWDSDIRSLVSAVDINICNKSLSNNRKRIRRRGKLNTSAKYNTSPIKKRIKRESVITPPSEINDNKRITRSSKKDITTSTLPPPQRRRKKKNDKAQNPETISKTEPIPEPIPPSTNNDFWINKNQPTKYKQKCNPTNVILDEGIEPFIIESVENTVVVQDSIDLIPKIITSVQAKSFKITNKSKETLQKSDTQTVPSITVTRCLQPYLETPVKEDFCGIPITPRLMSPTSIAETPITKLLNEQSETIDAALMPTPSGLSLTPLLAVTPKLHDYSSPLSYQSRPTDYSSCSSYYVPSEDQHKELEALILNDCKKPNNDTEKTDVVSTPIQDTENINSSNKRNTNSDESSSDNSCSSSNNSSSSDSSSSSSTSSNESTSKSESEDTTVIDNKKIVESSKNSDEKVTIEQQEDGKTTKKYESINVEINEKRLRTIIKFKQDAIAASKIGKSNKFTKTNLNTKKLPQRKSKASKSITNTTTKKPKATLASLLSKTRQTRSKLKSSNSSRLKVSLNDNTDKEDFPSLHISDDEDKSEAKNDVVIKPSTSAIDQFIQESDTESTIALVTHLKERGILLVPNKKNKQSIDTKSTPKINEESKSLPDNEKETKEHETAEKIDSQEVKSVEINVDNLIPNSKEKNSDDIEEDCAREFINVSLTDQIEVVFDDDKTVQLETDTDSCLDLNSSFAKYEVEYVIDDVTRTFQVSSFFDLMEMPPKPMPPKKRIIRRATSKQKIDESGIKTSSPKTKKLCKSYFHFDDEESNDVDSFLAKCSPIPKEAPKNQKNSIKSNDSVGFKNLNSDQNIKKVSNTLTFSKELKTNDGFKDFNSDKKEVSSSSSVSNNEFKSINVQPTIKNNNLNKLSTESNEVENDVLNSTKINLINNLDKLGTKFEHNKFKRTKDCFTHQDNDKIRKKDDNKFSEDYEEGECTNSEDENTKSVTKDAIDKKRNKRTSETIVGKKRKTSSHTPIISSDTKSHKKIKQDIPEKLLLNLDLDKFLTKVHGPNN